jgi:hypothetical protein
VAAPRVTDDTEGVPPDLGALLLWDFVAGEEAMGFDEPERWIGWKPGQGERWLRSLAGILLAMETRRAGRPPWRRVLSLWNWANFWPMESGLSVEFVGQISCKLSGGCFRAG